MTNICFHCSTSIPSRFGARSAASACACSFGPTQCFGRLPFSFRRRPQLQVQALTSTRLPWNSRSRLQCANVASFDVCCATSITCAKARLPQPDPLILLSQALPRMRCELALLLAWHGRHCNQRAMQPLHVTWSYARRGIFEPFNLVCFECYLEMLYTVFSEVNMTLRPLWLRQVKRRNLIFSVICCLGGRN